MYHVESGDLLSYKLLKKRIILITIQMLFPTSLCVLTLQEV